MNVRMCDTRPRKTPTSKTDENIHKIGKLIREENVCKNLYRSLNKHKVCAKIVPRHVTPERKKSRMNITVDVLNNVVIVRVC